MTKPMGQMGRNELEARIRELEAENRSLRNDLLDVLEGVKAATGSLPPAAQAILAKLQPPTSTDSLSMGVVRAPTRSCGVPGCDHQY
jgi:hypothetical protein